VPADGVPVGEDAELFGSAGVALASSGAVVVEGGLVAVLEAPGSDAALPEEPAGDAAASVADVSVDASVLEEDALLAGADAPD
jgi:hypothetical protein